MCVLLITHLNMFDKFKIVLQPPANQRLTHLQEALRAVGDELCRVVRCGGLQPTGLTGVRLKVHSCPVNTKLSCLISVALW